MLPQPIFILCVVELSTYLYCFVTATNGTVNVAHPSTNSSSDAHATTTIAISSTPMSNTTDSNPDSPQNTFHKLPQPPIWLNETFHFFFNPPSINDILVDSNRTVNFNCTTNSLHQYDINVNNISTGSIYQAEEKADFLNRSFVVIIKSHNGKVAKFIYKAPKKERHKFHGADGDEGPDVHERISMHIKLNSEHNFTIEAMHIGYVTISVTLFDTDNVEFVNAGLARKMMSYSKYQITVKRADKLADFVFDCSAAAVAILISFGIGCVTDTESLKRQLKYPVSLVIGFCCQFLIMPVLAFGIAKLLPLEDDVRFGLLCVACVPGGGLGHVAVVIGQADLPLSLAMNLISVVTMLGTAPLWIFVLGQYFQRDFADRVIPIYDFEIWLASTFFAYVAGLVINRFKPVVADALLTWLIKPFMLLAAILYITLGVYINMYVFEVIEKFEVLAAFLLPMCGFVIAYALAKIFRQKPGFCVSVALETSSLNCLITIAAIRFSLQPPSDDLASTIPIWIMFTIPGLYILLAILRFFKKGVSSFLESRKQQKFRHFSIASGIVNQANMAALSAPLFVSEVTDEEQGSVSEKITVL